MWEGRCDDSTCPRQRSVSHLFIGWYTVIGGKPPPTYDHLCIQNWYSAPAPAYQERPGAAS